MGFIREEERVILDKLQVALQYFGADRLFFQTAAMMGTVSVLILAVAALYPVLEKRFGAKWRKALWALVGIRLLIPVHYSFPNAPVRLFAVRIYPMYRWLAPVLLLWGAGTFCYLAFQFAGYFFFRRKCIAQMKQVENPEMTQMLSDVREELHISRRIPLYQCSFLRAPLVLGFRKQLLLIPDENYTYEDFKFILSHECTHIMKKDIWLKLLLTLVTGIYWFNPFIHWMKSLAFHDIELVCDSVVVKGKDDSEKEKYSRVILEVLKRDKGKSAAFSTDFYSGKNTVKERISAILRPQPKGAGGWLCLFAAAALYLAGSAMVTVGYTWQQETQDLAEADIYRDADRPPAFDGQALSQMSHLEPFLTWDYWPVKDEYEDRETAGDTTEASGPYETVVDDPDMYSWAAGQLANNFIGGYLNDEMRAGAAYGMDLIEFASTQEIIAGDVEEFVCLMNFRIYYPYLWDRGTADNFGWGIVSEEYIDCSWAIHVKRKGTYLFALEGIAKAEDALELFGRKAQESGREQIQEAYDMLPRPDIQILGNCQAKMIDGALSVTYDGGETWKQVPVSSDQLFNRGESNTQDGLHLDRGSFTVSEECTVFVYGGSSECPITVIYSPDQGKTWEKSVVDYRTGSRRLFVDMLDASSGYLLYTGDRTMSTEGAFLYKTEDGAKTWSPVGMVDKEGHSLVTGMSFAAENIGFVTMKNSEFPCVYRTEDGGKTWNVIDFNPMYRDYKWYREGYSRVSDRAESMPDNGYEMLRDYYTMAYAPSFRGAEGVMYVGMEEYAETGADQLKLVSSDYGLTWRIAGIVYRQEYRK